MSDAFPPPDRPAQPPQPVTSTTSTQPAASPQPQDAAQDAGRGAGRRRAAAGRLVPRSRGARWAALGAAVVIVGGAAVAVAVTEHHHDRSEHGPRFAWAESGPRGGGRAVGPGEGGEHGPGGGGELRGGRRFEGPGRPEGPRVRDGLEGPEAAPGRPGTPKTAPAPLPSLAIGAAAEKAAAAVPGGKVESLRVVAQEGGGSAWRAVVLGPDGVRHAVTVSGTDGTVTDHTTPPGR
ncbi:hypothetical protein [Streptomyces sp. NPDC091268]|uniref:hypothetical protein n=1 Tax=Streptomyces sp. NPDC091268 TaxID=3365979 RepID=UPI0038017D11